jgi:endogenous inhibitor of DNA gyrase (YacG/DUF329 family)
MNEREKALKLYSAGYGYKTIGKMMSISYNTVKSWIRRHGVRRSNKQDEGNSESEQININLTVPEFYDVVVDNDGNEYVQGMCLVCGKPVGQKVYSKVKMYCCDKCRNIYWTHHRGKRETKALYRIECLKCEKVFESYGNAKRKYCTHECYVAARFPDSFASVYVKSEKRRIRKPMEILLHRLNCAADSHEWSEMLCGTVNERFGREELQAGARRVHLVNRAINVLKGCDQLSMIIQERLKMDIMGGEIYAFCNGTRTHVKYIYWDGSSLRTCTRRKEDGQYIWPGAGHEPTTEISEREFEFLLTASIYTKAACENGRYSGSL